MDTPVTTPPTPIAMRPPAQRPAETPTPSPPPARPEHVEPLPDEPGYGHGV